ncbi:DUF5063 domain-containing protein [Kaarinaea lacus]
MDRVPLVCSRMAAVANEYCHLIDTFDGLGQGSAWLSRMGKMLPRLHVAVIALTPSAESNNSYPSPDDDGRIELYMRLHEVLRSDRSLVAAYGRSRTRQQLCDQLADDFTDMYFDLKLGLEMIPVDAVRASDIWTFSFYLHWGQHLFDAECRLRAVQAGEEPSCLSVMSWSPLTFAAA